MCKNEKILVFLHSKMKKFVLITLAFIALVPSGMAQLVPLVSGERNVLSLDLNRLYSYNRYELSRWGLGLQYDINFSEKNSFKTLSLSGYGAYGYADERFKWGLKADLQSRLRHQSHSYVEFFHDLTPDGSRSLNAYQLLSFNSTGSYMTRLFSDTWRLTVGFSRLVTPAVTQSFELRLSRERYLHNGISLFYPSSWSELKGLPHHDFVEGRLFVAYTSGFRGEFVVGVCGDFPDIFSEDFLRQQMFLRLLLQYDKGFYFSPFEFDFFAQAGYVNRDAPYSRLFDLGGTWGSPIAMGQGLLTARPNEFVTNLFALVNLRLATQKPLFDWFNPLLAIGTSPTPFVLCNAAWGKMGDYTGAEVPDKGIAEVGGGVDGLLVWGAVKWGGAVVYRLTPESADYHFSDPKDNLVFLLTAQLKL